MKCVPNIKGVLSSLVGVNNMNKILKLNDLIKQDFFEQEYGGSITMCVSNIDDIFRTLLRLEIKEIKVDLDTMFLIAQYVLANITCHPHYNFIEDDKKKYDLKWNQTALRLIQDPKVEKYFGVKLILE